MNEMIIILIATAMMARKGRAPRRRSMGRYVRGNIDSDLGLATLAAKTGVLTPSDTVIDRTLISSVVATYSLSNWSVIADVGPIEMVVAHSDYTLAEIEAWLELPTSWKETDMLDREILSRKIRRIGVFDTPVTTGGAYTLNDGKALKTKLNWIVTNGQGLNWMAYNRGTAAVATTNPNVNISGHANLWPR